MSIAKSNIHKLLSMFQSLKKEHRKTRCSTQINYKTEVYFISSKFFRFLPKIYLWFLEPISKQKIETRYSSHHKIRT